MRKINFRYFDKALFFTPIVIFLIGILTIYSASFKAHQSFDDILAVKQICWMGMGILLVFLVIRTDYFKLMDLAWPLYIASVVLLVAVFFSPARLGAHRWIGIAGFNIQPSEIAKFSVILLLARFFSNNRPDPVSKRRLLTPFLITGVPFLLIMKEPDLGSALLLLPVLFAMLYIWGLKPKILLTLMALGAAATPFLFSFLKEYQKARLLVFMNPNLDPLGAGYTIIQSKIAIGSGGLMGKGFLAGTQNMLKFLPERHTDFTFAVIGEEGGFAASLAIILLFWYLVHKGFTISSRTPDRFGSQLACGLTTLIGFQAILNIGMTMGVFPVVGVPLPLVSYGGSSVVVSMTAIAILLNIRMHRSLF